MAKITFITLDDEKCVVEASGGSLMEAAVENGIDGIDADCGGVCSCATCHVQVHPDCLEKTGPASDAEESLLELEDDANERSRLSCQIPITEELDGLVVKIVGR